MRHAMDGIAATAPGRSAGGARRLGIDQEERLLDAGRVDRQALHPQARRLPVQGQRPAANGGIALAHAVRRLPPAAAASLADPGDRLGAESRPWTQARAAASATARPTTRQDPRALRAPGTASRRETAVRTPIACSRGPRSAGPLRRASETSSPPTLRRVTSTRSARRPRRARRDATACGRWRRWRSPPPAPRPRGHPAGGLPSAARRPPGGPPPSLVGLERVPAVSSRSRPCAAGRGPAASTRRGRRPNPR